MQTPAGSVAALSAASATVFSIGIVFLGYWGMYEPEQWRAADVVVFVLALLGFACLGFVPYVATTPVQDASDKPMRIARRLFLSGVLSIWLAVALSVIF